MKIIVSLIILGLALFSASADAQTRKRKKNSKTKTVKKIPKTISAGVVNGKTINLVMPAYPQSARATNVYGVVQVQILIDETGAVILAEAISGHLLLQGAAVRAASESKFSPMTISGEPVRVNGIIIYNFIPNQWNWLEIGYAINGYSSYYKLKNLCDLFPSDFSEEAKLLKQFYTRDSSETDFSEVEETENESNILESIIASIRVKLSDDEKSSWLFSVGLTLGKIRSHCCHNSEVKIYAKEIKILTLTKPVNANSDLVSTLENFVLLAENQELNTYNPYSGSKIYQLLIDAESKYPFWGR